MKKIILDEVYYSSYLNYIKLSLKFDSVRAISSRYDKHIKPFFGQKNIFEISKKDVVEWEQKIDSLLKSYSYKKSIYVALIGILNYCIKFFELDKNVASEVGFIIKEKSIEKTSDFWTIKEFKKFIKEVKEPVYKTYFKFIFFTGVRLGESIALTFNDYDKGYIQINKTKTRGRTHSPKTKSSNRTFKIDLKLRFELLKLKYYYIKNFENAKGFIEFIKKFKTFDKNKFLFGYNKSLSESNITRYKNHYCKVANVKQIRIHDFRHSHITMCMNSNVSIKATCTRVGHKNPSTTLDIYTHLQKKDENRLVLKIFFKRLF